MNVVIDDYERPILSPPFLLHPDVNCSMSGSIYSTSGCSNFGPYLILQQLLSLERFASYRREFYTCCTKIAILIGRYGKIEAKMLINWGVNVIFI